MSPAMLLTSRPRRLWPWLGFVLACSDGSTGLQPVATVDVTPPAVTLASGQTSSLAATARDASGKALTERDLTWSTENAAIATVNSTGSVTGVAPGTTRITVTAEGHQGSAMVLVLTAPPASIAVTPLIVSILPSDTLRLSAVARDAQNGLLTGVAFVWHSDDERVATVDATGLVTGHSPGRAVLSATAGGATGSTDVDVVDPNAARILAVTPSVIVEGEAATLHGVNFDPILAANLIAIDGVRANLTTGTDSTLAIIVPSLGCRPRHVANLSVTARGVTTRFGHPARPASFFQLAAGQMSILQTPASYCLQFDTTSADEEYLVGVQSTASTASTVSSILIVSDSDDGAAAVATPVASVPLSSSRSEPDIPFSVSWRSREAEVMHGEIESLRALTSADVGAARTAAAKIPGSVTVGTRVTVRYPDLESGNTCSKYVEIQGTVRYVGTFGIWVSDDANPPDGYQNSDYAGLGAQFESQIYPVQMGYFGPPADLDGNGRVVMVVTKEVNDDRIGGMVPAANVVPQSICPGSNEGEYFFMFAADPSGAFGLGPFPVDNARAVAPTIIGHELVHNIHISRRAAAGHALWESWMHEGQATLGEEVLGHALTSPTRGPGNNYGWGIVRNIPATADRAWYYDAFRGLLLYYGWDPAVYDPQAAGAFRKSNAPESCTWLDTPGGANAGPCAHRGQLVYGVTWSFLRWLSDHYGTSFAGGESAMHKAWIDGAPSGFASIESLTGEPIGDLLAHWAASLYLDDRVAGLDPLLTLPSYNLFDIEKAVVPEARLVPRLRGYEDFQTGVQVRAGSSAYLLVGGANRPSTAIRVRSSTGGFVDPSVQVWVVRTR